MFPTLHITLLGDFELARGDVPIMRVKTARLQSLLAYLVLHRGTPQPRRRLAFLFWPETTDAQARTNLRRELHHLRRALPDADHYLSVDSQTIRWRTETGCTIDVAEFDAALSTADRAEEAGDRVELLSGLERAVGLYRGDLLPNCYDSWIDAERERMRRACDHALERLIAGCEAEGDSARAIRAAERLVARDPLREASHARLIELHAAAGDRAAAIRAFARCEEVLERELGMAPGPATRQARDAAMGSAGPPPAPGAPPTPEVPPVSVMPPAMVAPPVEPPSVQELPPLVGRERERDELREWVDRAGARDGPASGRILLLTGEPGIGKTRLLDELALEVRSRGGRTIRGRGFEAEMVRPYGAWIDALRSVPRDWIAGSADLGALIPEIPDAAKAPSDRSRLFDAFARWISDLGAGHGPVALVIDDIQWLDEASAALLHYLTRLLADAPVLMACAARPGEVEENAAVSGCLRSLERAGRVRTLALEPMGRDEVGALARSVDDAVDIERVYTDSGGNPLFALEVAHALVQRAAGESDTIDDLVRNRLARLDEPTGELLTWAAALGRSFDPSTAALVAERPLPDLLAVLDRLERLGILRPGESAGGEPTYDFAHDIVRRAAYARLSGPRRRLVHLQIARALNGLPDVDGALAGDVAHHAALGGDAALAASTCVIAGERCLRIFAYAEAAELARRGIEHAVVLEDTERVRLQMALMRVAVAAGVPPRRAGDLEEELRALIAASRPLGLIDEEARGYSLLSVLNYDRDDFQRVHESSLRAAETLHAPEARRAADPGVAARTLSQTGACLASIERDMPRAEALLVEAESLAERVGIELVDISLGLGIVRRFTADAKEAVRLLERGLRRARLEKDHYRAFECLVSLVMLELDTRASDRALARCEELADIASKLKGGSEAPFCAALDALARYALEEADAADDLAETLIALRHLDASRKLAYVQIHAAEVDLAAGRAGAALRRAEEALDAARVVAHGSGIALAGALRVRSALELGDLKSAREGLKLLRRERAAATDWSARAHEAVEGLSIQGEAPPAP